MAMPKNKPTGTKERRSFSHEIRTEKREEGQTPLIVGHAAVFNRLSDGLIWGYFREKIAPGAFKDCLDQDVRALFNHEASLILGRTKSKTLEIKEDDKGLHYTIDPPDTSAGRDLLVSMDRGDITQSSFAFTVAEDHWDEINGETVRTIIKVEKLYDVSPVTYPAYEASEVGLRSFEAYIEGKKEKRFDLIKKRLALLKI